MANCSICGAETDLACSDCGIESAGRQTVYVCSRSECRDEHERRNPQHPTLPTGEPKRTTLDEIEQLLKRDDEVELAILPNGEVRMKEAKESTGSLRPLTFRENLGGEYASLS